MWRLGNWISCRKELDFIKSQYREHARASIFLQSLKEHFKVKSGVLSKMSVNWVRFPCCSAGPTSAALISSNISQNQPTPHPALHKCTLQVQIENYTAHNWEAGSANLWNLPSQCTVLVLVAAKLKGSTGSRQSSGSTISASQRPLSWCGPSYQRESP